MPPEGQRDVPPVAIEIIVPAHNEACRLPDGLAALCRKAAALPLRAAILVVDSASTDPTGDVVRGWPAGPVPVGLLRCHRAGKGRAVRAGLLATRAPFVGFCDADMATDLSALDLAVSLLAAGNPAGHWLARAGVLRCRGPAQRRPQGRRRGVPRPGPADRPGCHRYPVRVQVLLRPAGPRGGPVAAHLGLRLRRRADRPLPAARRGADRDPGPLAGRARLDLLGSASLSGHLPRCRLHLAPAAGRPGPVPAPAAGRAPATRPPAARAGRPGLPAGATTA